VYTVTVVGGGAGGVELLLAVQHHLRQQLLQLEEDSASEKEDTSPTNQKLKMVLVTKSDTLLPSHNQAVRRIFQRILQERNVQVYCGIEVTGVVVEETTSGNKNKTTKRRLVVANNNHESAPLPLTDACFWCVTAGVADWLKTATPFSCTPEGNFLRVHDTYELIQHPGVFAAGDCCHMDAHPRPKAGVYAVRAGPVLLENLLRYCCGTTNTKLRHHRPQTSFLSLISTGDRYAVLSRGSWFGLEGAWLWKFKDWIDRRWMAQYSSEKLQEMMQSQKQQPSWWSRFWGCVSLRRFRQQRRYSFVTHDPTQNPLVRSKGAAVLEHFAEDPMRCGGCGAKVGSTVVARVLHQVHQRQVERALPRGWPEPPPVDHDDAAVTAVPTTGGGSAAVAMVQTIDYFREMDSDPFVFGKIVAVHALSDLHAMGVAAHTAQTLAVAPFAADENMTENTLLHLLSGVSDVLQDEGVRMVGGHTCEGLELACGLSVQGWVMPSSDERLLRKRGGRIGDRIVLTKPLGTGALFAAEMRGRCTGEYVQEAVDRMTQSSRAASQVAQRFNNGGDSGKAEGRAVHACTDVTGFGLVGHLLEMLMANEHDDEQNDGGDGGSSLDRIGAVLRIKDMPFYRGGLEASANGIYSTLQPSNARNRRAVRNHTQAAKAFPVEYPLLFDPQTAGGLLFFVDPDRCDDFVAQLQADAGVTAAVIGELEQYERQPPSDSSTAAGEGDTAGVCTIGSGDTATGLRIRIDLD